VNASILFVLTTLDRGGAETQVLELARGWRRRGRDVRVASLIPGGVLLPAFEEAGLRTASLGMRRGIPDPRAAWRLADLMRRQQPDIVHGHMVHANLLSRTARLVSPVRLLVNTAHSVDEEGRLREAAYRLTAPLCDLLTNVSLHGTERFRQLHLAPNARLRHVPNGIDPARLAVTGDPRTARRALGVPDRAWVWLSVGRLVPPKDPVTLVRAFAAHAAPDEVLLIAGRGELDRDVKLAVRSLDVGNRVLLLGDRDDVPSLLAAADAVVLSSRWEGQPMVQLEAAAARRLLIATAAPGTVDVVEDGVTGILAAVGDVDALGAAMRHARALPPGAREAILAAAGAQLQSFTIERVLDRWEELYASFLAPAARCRTR